MTAPPALALTPEILAQANVHPASGLATDYLNVFNEALMLLSLAGDDPDMLDELVDWAPPDYATHFRHSGFAARDVIIAAYEAAPPLVRAPFDAASAQLAASIQKAVAQLTRAQAAGGDLPAMIHVITEGLQRDIARLDSVIHGGVDARAGGGSDTCEAQAAIDALFGE